MASAVVQKQQIDANTTSRAVFPVSSHVTGTIQVDSVGLVAWTSGVLEVKRSNDGTVFYSFPSAVTLSANGMTDILDLSGVAFISAEMTTVNGAALLLNVAGCFKS